MHFEKYLIFGNGTLYILIYQQPKKIKGLRPVVEKEAKVERVNISILTNLSRPSQETRF